MTFACPLVVVVVAMVFAVLFWPLASFFFDDCRLSVSLGVSLCGLLVSMGERLRVLALRNSGESESSSFDSSGTGCGVDILLPRVADLVTGPT